jgi:pyruvate/2-oxoacid:ferredoxin oxidoreductase alpha subunit
MMQTDVPPQEAVDAFLPVLDLPHRVADEPVAVGSLDRPRETEVHRKQHAEAMARTWDVWGEVQDAFASAFGRRPADAVVPYRLDDADVVLVSMGTTASTVKTAVDEARERGIAAGALRVFGFRPFPEGLLRRHLEGRARVGVIDRDVSLGFGGVLWGEVRGVVGPGTLVQGYMAGLGGGDVRPEHVLDVLDDLLGRDAPGEPVFVETGS